MTAGVFGTIRDCGAADLWGGSLGITNDYLVRGISRSDDQAAIQADFHYVSTSGFIAGVFASTAKIDHHDSTGAELDAFLGFAWSTEDWHYKALVNHYAYPGTHDYSGYDHGQGHDRDYREGHDYDYDELVVDASFRDWLDASVVYSPDFRRDAPYHGLVRGDSISTELNLQYPIYKKLYATGGSGYSYQSGPGSGGYVYWSVGAAYTVGSAALALSYIDTSAAAKSLFYGEAAAGRWAATVIWRF